MDNYIIDSFTVRNYRSIYKEQTVYFNRDTPVTAFYGANASGKTNVYRALRTFCRFIKNSTSPSSHGVPYDPFLLQKKSTAEPSYFAVVFHNGANKYKYSFSLLGEHVADEEMYDLTSSRPRTVFVRSHGATELAAKNGFGKKMFVGNDAVRDDSLLITLAQRTKNKYANAVFSMCQNIRAITLTGENRLRGFAVDILQKHPEMLPRIIEILKKTDFAITDFAYNITRITSDMLVGAPFSETIKEELLKNGKNVSISTTHAVRDENGDKVGMVTFDMERQESLGTNVFFDLIVMVVDAIDNGYTLYFDEFGANLHTNICQYVIKVFKREGVKTGAKLIVNTHDTGLIKNGIFGVLDRRDIVITDKDRFEETIITPLSNKISRPDDNIGKKYTMGIYGGVPILEEAE